MATIARSHGAVPRPHPRGLTTERASRIAWWTWFALLIIPFVFFLFVAFHLMNQATPPPRDQSIANSWFIGTMVYLAIAFPLAMFWRSYAFRAYWKGDVVAPGSYLAGMISVWLAIEIGGLVSLVGCLRTGAFMPCMIPAMVAFMFFLPLWPSGHAMVLRNVGNVDDPGRYEEPR